jgi:hypothetical protein
MFYRRLFFILVLLLATQGLSPFASTETSSLETPAKPSIETTHAMLQGLDKITGRVLTIIAGIDEVVTFGTLKIRVVKCLKTSPEELPDSVAFLEIQEEKPKAALYNLFAGWMFASNPSLSALEHPVYDIWIKECTGKVRSGHTSSKSLLPNLTPAESSPPLPPINPEDIDEAPPILTPEAIEQEQIDALYEGLDRNRPETNTH